MFRVPLAIKKDHQAASGDQSTGDDQARAKPVVFLPFVEQDLKRSNCQGQQSQPDAINTTSTLPYFFQVGRIFDNSAGEQQRNDADWDIQEEDPTPGVVIGNPAANSRPDRG